MSDIINVSISIESGGLSRAGFGVMNYASYHLSFTERSRTYSSLPSVADDFASTSPEYLAASAYFSQSPRPSSMMISRLQVDHVTMSVVAGYDDTATYTCIINGTTFSSVGAGSAIATAAALVAAINGGAEPVTATDNSDGTYELEADVPGTAYTLAYNALSVATIDKSDETWTDGLNAIKAYSNEFYGLAANERTEASILLIAAWAETNDKLFGTASSDAEIVNTTLSADTGSIAKQLNALNYNHTFDFYHSKADGSSTEQYIESAEFGKNLTVDLDVTTSIWGQCQLTGVTADDLSDTYFQNATGTNASPTSGKNVNVFVPMSGVDIVRRGQVVSGEWIDTIIGVDWLKARMEERIRATIVNARARGSKVPFTQAGIDSIANDVIAQLQVGIRTGFLAFDADLDESLGFLVVIPKRSEMTSAQVASRNLTGITFTATIAGAIQTVTISGVVGV